MNVNDSFSHGLGGDTLAEYYFNKVKQKTKEDYFPPLNSEDLIGEGDSVGDEEEQEPAHDYSLDYLTFVALEDGTFSFSGGSDYSGGTDISYSLDNGETWVSLSKNTATPTISAGSEILWKKSSPAGPQQYAGIGTFSSTNSYEVKGNIMSLFYEDDFVGQTRIPDPYGFLYPNQYPSSDQGIPWVLKMFANNTHLVSAENLSLETIILGVGIYGNMFSGCTSLVKVPKLPVTELAYKCYGYMFQGCTSLTSAPELPATELADGCYYGMFSGCTSLEIAPILPALKLEYFCYNSMFYGCTSLNYIKAMFATPPSNSYTYNWVNNVAATGTFVKNSDATWTTTGVNGIPTNWTVETADE